MSDADAYFCIKCGSALNISPSLSRSVENPSKADLDNPQLLKQSDAPQTLGSFVFVDAASNASQNVPKGYESISSFSSSSSPSVASGERLYGKMNALVASSAKGMSQAAVDLPCTADFDASASNSLTHPEMDTSKHLLGMNMLTGSLHSSVDDNSLNKEEASLDNLNCDASLMEHPICSECMESLYSSCLQLLENIQKEYDAYDAALRSLAQVMPAEHDLLEDSLEVFPYKTEAEARDKDRENKVGSLWVREAQLLHNASQLSDKALDVGGAAPFVSQTDDSALNAECGSMVHPIVNTFSDAEAANVDFQVQELDATIVSGEHKYSALSNEFKQVTTLQNEVDVKRNETRFELEYLDLLELKDWLDFSKYIRESTDNEEELAATNACITYMTRQLNQLKHAHVIQDTFKIVCDSQFGSINGLRMGRLVPYNISWEEINAAWGQVCLLMEIILKKLSIELTTYRLIPRGSYSLVVRKSDNSEFELYSNEGALSRFFLGGRFDQAMVAFLTCMEETLYHLRQRQSPNEKPIEFPHKIERERIDGLSIRLQFHQNQRWTKAMKLMLLNLQWLSNYVEQQGK